MIRPLVLLIVLCCFGLSSQAQEVIRGSFESKSGVMDIVSCHCGEGGYISSPFGDRTPICLDDMDLSIEDGAEVTLVGDWSTSSIEPDDFSPCPNEDFEIFVVTEVHQGDDANVGYERFEGTFESTKGKMDKLSCFCYDGGYLEIGYNEYVELCFSELDESQLEAIEGCERIRVMGGFVEKHIEYNPQSPCSGGSMLLLMVTKVECL